MNEDDAHRDHASAVLRDYRDADLLSVVALFTASVHALTRHHYDLAQRQVWAPAAPDHAAWSARLRAQHTRVALLDGSMAGFVSFDRHGHLDLLFVHPDAAGRGVATRLLADAEAMMWRMGVRVVELEASLTAAPVFAARGYERLAAETVARAGQSLLRYRMRKLLVAPCHA